MTGPLPGGSSGGAVGREAGNGRWPEGGTGWAWWLFRYGLALLLPAVTLALRLHLGEAFEDRPLMVGFLLPVLICAFIGGQGPGLLATLVTALEVNLFLLSPRLTLALSSADAVHWFVLILNGVLVSVLAGAWHRARRGDAASLGVLPRHGFRRFGPLPLELNRTERLMVALAMPFLACALQWVLWEHLRPFIWFLFYPAVFMSAWVAGLAGALPSALIAALLAVICFHPPAMSLDKGGIGYLPSVLVFLAMAALYGRIHDRLAEAEQQVLDHLESERQLKEIALKSQAELLARMSRVAKVGGWEFDVLSGEGAWTEEVARIYDLDPATRVSVGLGMAYFLPASRAQLEQAVADAAGLARPFDLELEMETAKGLHKWVRSQGFPVVDQGRVVRIIGALQDITDRKLVEDQLLSSERMFTAAFTQNPAAIALSRLEDGVFLDVNATWETLTGRSREEAIGHSARTMGIWPTLEDAQRFVQELKGQGVVRGWEQSFLTKRGDTFVAELAAQLLSIRGETYIISTLVDITQRCHAEAELKASRAKLETALASMTDAVFISDREGRFIEFNEAFATFHKFSSKAECSKTFAEYPAILDVFLPDGSPAPVDQWAVSRALRGETASNEEYALRRKDTGETWVGSFSFAPIRDEHGAIVGSVVAGRDITGQKRTQEEIEHLNASLELRVAERTAELTAANA
ncbi:MAG TPA: PAS domain S-box protein [Geothrix sp.]|nr:PAS domain S-box protein [Geothrix sp.]